MQKILISLAATGLLAGCQLPFAVAPVPAEPAPIQSEASQPRPLTESRFVDLSARVLCLGQETADKAALEAETKKLFAEAGVTREQYLAFQKQLAAAGTAKDIELAIIGAMQEVCKVGQVGN